MTAHTLHWADALLPSIARDRRKYRHAAPAVFALPVDAAVAADKPLAAAATVADADGGGSGKQARNAPP